MDLSTQYLGLKLRNPIVASASTLSQDINNLKQLEEAGIGAVVMHSLFEEQIVRDETELRYGLEQGTDSYAEATSYFPVVGDYQVGPEEYLKNLEKAKKAIKVPLIGSLNGTTAGGWLKYAKNIEAAGADALELNIYHIPTDPIAGSADVEQLYQDIVARVKGHVKIPVSVKLGPYFSAIVSFAKDLEASGADGLVLFNRFYQPDINLDEMEVLPKISWSTAAEMRLPLRWVAILRNHVGLSLGATTGIHDAAGVVKMVLVGADATMMCSSILINGVDYVRTVINELEAWMKEHEYSSIKEMKGIMSHRSSASSEAFERANYLKTLLSYRR